MLAVTIEAYGTFVVTFKYDLFFSFDDAVEDVWSP
jgi:hypothetical protein